MTHNFVIVVGILGLLTTDNSMMKKLLFSIILIISLSFNFANAEEIKQTKQVKETKKKELSKEDEEFLKEFKKLDDESKEIEKTRKTLDEIKNKLNIK